MQGLRQEMIVSGQVKYHPALEDLLQPIDTVRPHPDNPSSGDEEAVRQSIEISGMYRPVYAQTSTGYILAGNTTYAACLDLGADLIPIVWLDVDEETAIRILLGDNELARRAIVDLGLLGPQIDKLLATEMRLLGSGYEEAPPPPPLREIEPGHTVTVHLTGETMVQWFDLPGEGDREKLLWLIDRR
jgi:hypothetical protein